MASTSDELFEAIEADDEEAVRRMLADDPSLAGARDEQGVSALMRALYRSNEAIASVIRPGVPSLDVFEAATLGDVDRLRTVLHGEPSLATAYSGDGFTPLHFAAFFGHPDAVALLLDRDAEVDALGRGWMTGTALHSAAARANRDAVRALLAAGADPNGRRSGAGTPLHAAAANADLASVDALLVSGADPAARREDGRSVLDLAEERGDAATIERIRRALQASP